MKEFELKLKDVRTNKGLKQSELAEIIGSNQRMISKYELGLAVPSLERLVELAQVLDVTLDDLVEFKQIQHNLSKELIK